MFDFNFPAHWQIIKLKYLAKIYNGNSINDYEKEKYTVKTNIPYIATKDVNLDYCIADYENGLFVPEDSKFRIAPAGSTLLCIEGGSAGKKKAFLTRDVAFVNKLCAFVPTKISGKFLFYAICSPIFKNQFDRKLTGMIGGVAISDLKNIKIPVPPLDEQEKIVRYLDKKTAQISTFIDAKKKEVALLDELKRAIIAEAVTKGLHGDSSHWKKIKLKYCLKTPLQYGANSAGVIFDENLPRYIRITDIISVHKLSTKNKLSLSLEESQPYLLEDEDILFARSGATSGKTFMYSSNFGAAAFAGYLIRAKINREKLLPKFFLYFTQSTSYESWKEQSFIQATIQNISAEKYKNLPLPLPPMEEQKEIAAYLDTKCAKIEKLMAALQDEIKFVEELRVRIISDVVTGKKDVRGLI